MTNEEYNIAIDRTFTLANLLLEICTHLNVTECTADYEEVTFPRSSQKLFPFFKLLVLLRAIARASDTSASVELTPLFQKTEMYALYPSNHNGPLDTSKAKAVLKFEPR